MIKTEVTLKEIIKKVQVLKGLLIGLTVLQIVYLVFSFFDIRLLQELNTEYRFGWILFMLHYLIAFLFILFIWKRMPVNKNKKSNDTFLILFFGLIGMWLWMPNQKELNKLKLVE